MNTTTSKHSLRRLARPALFALIATLAIPAAAGITGSDIAFAADKGGNDGGRGGGGMGGGRGGDEPMVSPIAGGPNCTTYACNPPRPERPKITRARAEKDRCEGPARRVQVCTTQDDGFGFTTTCRVVVRTNCETTN